MNGTLLISSKDPFKYQGVSFQIKQGVMHMGDTRVVQPHFMIGACVGSEGFGQICFQGRG